LASGIGRVFLGVEAIRRSRFKSDGREVVMDWALIVAGAIAGALCIYLFVALLKPEWFE